MIIATATFTPNDAIRHAILLGVQAGVTAAAKLVSDEAAAIVPIDTGDLMLSIRHEEAEQDRDASGSGNAFTSRVVAGTDHAFFVEYGTGVRGAESEGAGPGPYDPTWPGMVAQPYLRPAVQNVREEAMSAIGAEVASAIG